MKQEDLSFIAQRIRAFADTPDHHSLYPHQVEILHTVADHLEAGHNDGTVKAATGTGKTYALTAMAVASGEPTVIVTPRNLIGDQTLDTFMDPEKFNIDAEKTVGIYDGKRNPIAKWQALKKPVLITTYPSFIKLVQSGKISADPKSKNYRKNIILDEAHRGVGPEFVEQIGKFENSIVTAWTATDTFADGRRVDDILFGGKDRIYTLELPDAVRRGLLADAIKSLSVEVGIDESEVEKLRQKNRDYPQKEIEKFALNQGVQEHAVEMYMNHVDQETGIAFRGLPCLVNTLGVQAAKDTAARFNAALGPGMAVAVSGETPKHLLRNKEKTGIFDRYDRGEIKVICAADLLIEGFDSKDVSVVMSLRPSTSPWLVEQMLGRGARKQSHQYFERFGHDKHLFAVNFFGKGMQPLLFSDIIEGLEIKTKIREPRIFCGERTPPVPYLPTFVFDVPPRTFATTTELAGLKKEWSDKILPEKTNDDLTLPIGVLEEMQIPRSNLVYASWREATERAIDRGEIVMVGNHPVQKMRMENHIVLCLNRHAIPMLAEKLGLTHKLPEKTDNDLTIASEVPEKLRIHATNSTYSAWRKATEEAIERDEVVMVGKYSVQKMQSRSHTPLCLHKDAISTLATDLKIAVENDLPKKTSDDLSLSYELSKALRLGLKNPAYNSWRQMTEEALDRGETVEVGTYPVQKMRSTAKPSFCLNKDAIPALAALLNITLSDLPEKTDDYLAISEALPEEMGIGARNSKYVAWRKTTEAAIEQGKSVMVGEHPVQKMRSKSQTPICLHKNAAPILTRQLGINEGIKNKISPDSPHIRNRPGRSRGPE